jgi:hypothetical protein
MGAPARFALSGALAGATSALAFMVLHDWLISDIWFSLPIMLVAGAASGAALAWSYRLLFNSVGYATWALYNGFYVVALALLGVASVVVFEPVTTVAAVLASPDGPGDLTRLALPLSLVFTVAAAGAVHRLWGRGWSQFGAVLLTSALLVFLLGSNVAIIGLVELTTAALPLIALTFALIMALAIGFAVIHAMLEHRAFRGAGSPSAPAPVVVDAR